MCCQITPLFLSYFEIFFQLVELRVFISSSRLSHKLSAK